MVLIECISFVFRKDRLVGKVLNNTIIGTSISLSDKKPYSDNYLYSVPISMNYMEANFQSLSLKKAGLKKNVDYAIVSVLEHEDGPITNWCYKESEYIHYKGEKGKENGK